MKRDTSHYFDWAATSPADEALCASALEKSLEIFANPSSAHSAGANAKSALESARKKAANAIGVSAKQIFFTSGGTESNQIVLLSLLTRPQKGSLIISAIEHPSIREQAAALKNCGWEVISVLPDKNGFVSAESVVSKLKSDTALVCVMAVNNETGAIQPIYEIADAILKASAGKRKPKFHVDCVQAAGKIALDISHPGIDSASFSAHKIEGPRGTGILYLKGETTPFLRGGGQERGIRSGTENLFGAIAFSECLEKFWIKKENPVTMERFRSQEKYTAEFIEKLQTIDGCTIIPESRGKDNSLSFSPWIVQAAFKDIPGQVMVRALDAKGFFISTGSACSASKQSRPILEAMGIESEIRQNAVRFSFGFSSEKSAMDELFCAVREIVSAFRG